MTHSTTNPTLTPGGTPSTPVGTDGLPGSDAPMAARASTGGGRDRVHRFAGTMHRAIDGLEHRLGSARDGMSSTQARYRDSLRTRMNEQPLQSAGLALAAGVLLDRLFLRGPKERVLEVPVRTHSKREANPAAERRRARWSDAAEAHLQRLGRTGREAAGKAGAAAAQGLAGTRAVAAGLAREANALPLQMRLAARHLAARSHEYGSLARSTVKAHPWAGLAAMFAAGGLLTTVLMRRREPGPGMAYVADERGTAWQRSGYDAPQEGLGGRVASRPWASSAVVLGLGVLAALMLRRRGD